jgi:hypothetical protein
VTFFGPDASSFWTPGSNRVLGPERALFAGLFGLVVGAAGLVGGLVYWSIEGRNAGREPQ